MIIYTTPSWTIGRTEWRIEVREVNGERFPLPTMRRAGTDFWLFPADAGALPVGLLQLALQNAVAIGRAMESQP